ncbi:MAG: hypothetical protein WCL32_02665 [Planctomycetota bacterium]|jgi:hypothetical protein
MPEILVEETGLPLQFPHPRIEATKRALEFQALPGAERLRIALEMMAMGLRMVESSPRRTAIEARWAKQEDEYRDLQDEIARLYGR